MSIPPVNPDGQSLDYSPQSSALHVAGPAAQLEQQVLTPSKKVKEERVKVARDRAQYVRQQKGHSWFIWWLILGPVTLWIPAIYFSVSPNHYWHI
ncbi:hypothetical protein SEA_NEFERTHENA_62 [Microbacterium phage Neferthena]|uniref:Uncharacterized protein n=1 Tax=Microbacterium phage Neferthena TaxID=2301539 RepID=A0A385D3P2_9CAUD|nr:hypothetical protein HOT92_gp40 [Microbacterium phage Neferthena]AXQ52925.1 hypothetical protein SEA_NEFERTHENA_62 [Microbacterium phage Neferthena]